LHRTTGAPTNYYYGDRAEEINLEYHAGLRGVIISAIRSSFHTDFAPYFPQDFVVENIEYYGSYVYFDIDSSMQAGQEGLANDHVAVMITVEDYDYTDVAWEPPHGGSG